MADDSDESEDTEPTPDEIAAWMVDSFDEYGRLIQWRAAEEIRKQFGVEFTYVNGNGNFAIDKAILKQFKALTKDSTVWSKSGQYWRLRTPEDPPDKRQVP